MDKGENALGRYFIIDIDDKIIVEKLKKLTSMEPKVMIHRALMDDHRANKSVSKYRWRYLTTIRIEEG